MHIPDGFFDAPTSVAAAGASVGVLSVAVRRTRTVLDERQIPLAAVTAAFVFALQMVNFPVAAGTSGHVLGGALAAILVGPWLGIVAVTVVVAVQAMFGDGGLTALGLNVLLIAIIPTLVGYAVFRISTRVLPLSRRGAAVAAGVAAGVSLPVTAAAFSFLFAIGGTTPVEVGTLAGAMVGTHAVIGIGEGLVTALVVGTVLASRPDLVHGSPVRRLEPVGA